MQPSSKLVLTCEKYRIQVDAVSSDGQFCKMAIRAKDGSALTLLQLQKDLWEECKKLSKAEQMKSIYGKCMSNLRPLSCHIPVGEDGSIHGPISVTGYEDRKWSVVYTPKNISTLIKPGMKKEVAA